MPPEQAPDRADLQAVAEPLVNDRVSLPLRLAARGGGVAAIPTGLLAGVKQPLAGVQLLARKRHFNLATQVDRNARSLPHSAV